MRILFFLAMLFGSCQLVQAQETPLPRKNLIFLEGGGAFAAGVGLGYERYFGLSPRLRFTARGGAGMIDHFNKASYFAGSSVLWGRKWQAELGLNYVSKVDKSTFKPLDEGEERFTSSMQGLVGVRYQNWSNGLFFRLFYVPPFGAFGSWIPYGGISAGWAF